MACSEKSSIPTSKDDSLVDLSIFERNSVFLVPERRISCRAKPTCGDRAKRGAARAKRGMKFVSEGTKKPEFLPRMNESPSESPLIVEIELFSLPWPSFEPNQDIFEAKIMH